MVAAVVGLDSNSELGRRAMGYNGRLKYRRRSIGAVRNPSPVSLLSSDDADSQFSERISLMRKDLDVDDIDNSS